MNRKINLAFIKKELNFTFSYFLIKLLDLFGWGITASYLRAKILKLMGFKIGNGSKLMTGVTIHSNDVPLEIGDETFINKNVFFDVGSTPIKIGNYCDIGFNTVFSNAKHVLKSDFQTRRGHEKNNPILVEDFVWIGCNATILGGVTIGKGSVVAAGSVVVSNIPANSLAAGIPAKVIKEII